MTETATPESGDRPDNGPALTKDEFEAEFRRLRRWSGPDTDERGTLAGLTDRHRLDALSAARTGRAVSLAMPINRHSGPDNNRPALHHMVDLGDVEAPEPSAHKDFIARLLRGDRDPGDQTRATEAAGYASERFRDG